MISKFYNWLKKKYYRDDIVIGLIGGLVILIWSFVSCLAVGIAVGLVWGLINYSSYDLSILQSIIIALVLMEIVYFIQQRYFEKKRYESIWIVLIRKLEALFDVLIIGINILNVYWIFKTYNPFNWIVQHKDLFIKIFGYVGLAIILCLLIWGYLWLNWQIKPKKKSKKAIK